MLGSSSTIVVVQANFAENKMHNYAVQFLGGYYCILPPIVVLQIAQSYPQKS